VVREYPSSAYISKASDLRGLQTTSTWTEFATIVQVEPDDDTFPVRAKYVINRRQPLDRIISKAKLPMVYVGRLHRSEVLFGKPVKIKRAITFTRALRRKRFVHRHLWQFQYRSTPEKMIFPAFDRPTNASQGQAETRNSSEAERLDSEQQALKILANSRSLCGRAVSECRLKTVF